MALFATFGELLTMLRAEARLSTNPAVGAGANIRHKAILNRVYATLCEMEWPHLKYIPPRIPLSAGQRFYDAPAGLDFNRATSFVAWEGVNDYPLDPGIGTAEYSVYDSVNDARADPPLRYDLRATALGTVQVEIWPIPASNTFSLEVAGIRTTPKLVNSADICLLDDHLVVLFAAESVLRAVNKDDADGKLAAARQHLALVRGNSALPQTAGSTAARVGVGPVLDLRDGRASVRVR